MTRYGLSPCCTGRSLVAYRSTFGYFYCTVCVCHYPVAILWPGSREIYLWLGNKAARTHECWFGRALVHILTPLVTFSDFPSLLDSASGCWSLLVQEPLY
ncbi:hypothetical protein LIER_02989 [Lithospermum erythrorhizon]|uniref:Uncharacterized protein n=1 Tax=Lithospermum erythrorhizon TaxID=34254 RepID=A0AAV3NRM0_LITER